MSWRLPFDGTYAVTQDWGYDPTYVGNYQHFHYGIDWALPSGTPVLAVADGQVIVAAPDQPNGFPGCSDGTWGKYIAVRHVNGVDSGYAHLSDLRVYASQWVKAGELLGYSGATGFVTGPHLHLHVVSRSKRIDPNPFF